MVQLPSNLPSRRKLLAYIVGLFIARLLWKLGRFIHHILTSVDQSKVVNHDCIPPDDYKHQEVTQQSTLDLVRAKYPELVGLVESGNLLAVQPAKMLKQALANQYSNQDGEQGPPGFTEEDVQQLVTSTPLQSCMSAPVPELMFIVGTVHVSKQSGEDVKQVIKALQPAAVVLELCHQRLQALLVDPYEDPLVDMEPSKTRLAQQQQAKPKSVPEILRAALSSRDHNVLTTMMAGMYSRFEDKLEVRAGLEFIAARQALIEMLQEQQQQQQRTHDGSEPQQQQQTNSIPNAAAETAETSAPAERNSSTRPAEQQQQHHDEEQQLTWLQKVVPGDRPLLDTLLGLWGALRPLRRLRFVWELLNGLFDGVDEEIIKALANEDMVELLLKDFREAYPEVMKPLLHDRNWVLATNTWHVAQRLAHQEGPVVAIVGKGHMGGMVYVCERLVELFVKTGGMPVQLVVQHPEVQ